MEEEKIVLTKKFVIQRVAEKISVVHAWKLKENVAYRRGVVRRAVSVFFGILVSEKYRGRIPRELIHTRTNLSSADVSKAGNSLTAARTVRPSFMASSLLGA